MGPHLTHGGALTATGRARAALSAYLRVLDRQYRLAAALGLERRARPVEEVDHYLDQFARRPGLMTRLRPLRQPTIRDVVRDWFPSFTDPSWAPWHTFLGAVFGLELDTDEIGRYRLYTGRCQAPTQPVREVWTIVGRRGGKSQVAALLTVFLTLFRRYTLARGERGVVMVLAADRRQARVVMRYIGGLINAVPALAAKITRCTAEAIDFNNGISVEIHTSSFRSVRGYTVVAVILVEVAYWPPRRALPRTATSRRPCDLTWRR